MRHSRKSSVGATKTVEKQKLIESNSLKLLVAEEMKVWEARYLKEIEALKEQLLEVKKSQDFMYNQHDKLKQDYDSLHVISENQEEEIKILKSTSKKLEIRRKEEEEKADSYEKYERRQNLEIAGIPVRENENTNNIVTEVAKMVNMKITSNQVSTSHRLQAKPKRSRPWKMMSNETPSTPPFIIVRFLNRDIHNELCSKRKSLRPADLNNFSIKGITISLSLKTSLTIEKNYFKWQSKE